MTVFHDILLLCYSALITPPIMAKLNNLCSKKEVQLMADAQVKLTDVIREEIVEFLHSEDCLDEARHLRKYLTIFPL